MPIKPTTGERVSWKQFWKEFQHGMEQVTPLQQAVITQWGHVISGIGVVWGIIFSMRLRYWWMAVILLGGFIVLCVQYLGNWQKKIILKKIDATMKIAELNSEGENGDNGLLE